MAVTWENTPTISTIKLPTGSQYYIKDEEAREYIENAFEELSGAMHFIGVTSSLIVDGSRTNPIIIDDEEVTAEPGDVVIVGTTGVDGEAPKEYVFNGTKWSEFGSTGSLKALAFKDTASGTYVPGGTINELFFTGTEGTYEGFYTPTGTITQPDFTGYESNVTVSGTPAGEVTIAVGEGTVNYTPEGNVSQSTFSGTPSTIEIGETEGTSTYVPAGTVSAPEISCSVPGNTTMVNSITDVGTLPVLTTTVSNEVLSIGFNQGTLPTKGSNTEVKTSDGVYEAAAPSFSGTGAHLSGTYTPSGTVSKPNFTGTGVDLSATFEGSSLSSTGTFTPSGSISTPRFEGNQAEIEVSGTPAGTITQPLFTGNTGSVTVS